MWTQLQDEMSFGNLLVTALISWLLEVENIHVLINCYFAESGGHLKVLFHLMPSSL
ncbi:hypothetical protein DPMN_097073 [Dreissena polymorpha]|uniref:Uncharacterized protein n=1 Tax=Dreissena polymorpha TaxID=45954 RepID=A0A9D4LAL1_DREPO|nr:hypothetical protein DPMN_097073 [Dreissena polymorpha]